MKEVKLYEGWDLRDPKMVRRHESSLSNLLNEGWELESSVSLPLDWFEGVLFVLVRDTDVDLDIMTRKD